MCNEHRRLVALGQISHDWSQTRIPLIFPEGLPNLAPLDSIRITDNATIIRAATQQEGAAELVQRRWSWPAPGGKPVFNFRSEGREFGPNRCLIVADGFYEYTSREADAAGKPKARGKKDRWLFTKSGEDWFCIAGIWRRTAEVGEAFTMLTTEPGPDIAPYHDRQIVLLTPSDYARWLDGSAPAADLCRPVPAGRLVVRQVR